VYLIHVVGTYQSGKPIITIMNFAPKLSIIVSKQRPRRLYLKGSDGKEYQYLLKGTYLLAWLLPTRICNVRCSLGHEDLRQDERVMQLFSLVNTLLSEDTDSFKRRLHIQRYPVIPLGPHAGLLGWVHDSDTLHVLVRDYRESRKVLLNIEYRLMLQASPLSLLITIVRLTAVRRWRRTTKT
jgi:FKBP12-rapamycin complex-associated protein